MNESIDYYLSDEEESLLLITVIGKRFTKMRFIADSDTLLDYRNYVDIKKNKSVLFFDVIGLNSIFIYLFFELIGGGWLNHYISLLIGGLLSYTTLILPAISIISCLFVFAIEWGICYFLYRKKIFFRL